MPDGFGHFASPYFDFGFLGSFGGVWQPLALPKGLLGIVSDVLEASKANLNSERKRKKQGLLLFYLTGIFYILLGDEMCAV